MSMGKKALLSWLDDVVSVADPNLTIQDLERIADTEIRLQETPALPFESAGIEVHDIYSRSLYPLPAYSLDD